MLFLLRLAGVAVFVSLGLGGMLSADHPAPSFENVRGPSFPCDQELTDIEQMLCSQPENLLLAPLDRLLSEVYVDLYTLQNKAPTASGAISRNERDQSARELEAEQFGWLESRNQMQNAPQLESYYKQRISDLALSYVEAEGTDTWWFKGEENLPVPYIRHFNIVIANGHFALTYESLGAGYNGCWLGYFGTVDELSEYVTLELTRTGIELGVSEVSLEHGGRFRPSDRCNGPSFGGSYGGNIWD